MSRQYYSTGLDTRIKIISTLKELCQEKDYGKVSVIEICQRAAINRSTFYHHFENRESIVRWYAEMAYNTGIDKIGRSYNWYQGHLMTSRMLNRYEDVFYQAGKIEGYESIRQFFERHRKENLTETLTAYQNKQMTRLLEFQILATATLESALGVLHFKGAPDLSIEEYCKLLCSSIPKELYDALNTPVCIDQDADLLFLLNTGNI